MSCNHQSMKTIFWLILERILRSRAQNIRTIPRILKKLQKRRLYTIHWLMMHCHITILSTKKNDWWYLGLPCDVLMRCIVCSDVQRTSNKIMNFTPSAGCLLCNVTLHTEVWLQVQRDFNNLVYWENSVVKLMLHTKCKRIKLETEGN